MHSLFRRVLPLAAGLLLACPLLAAATTDAQNQTERDLEAIRQQLDAMPAQRPGHPDLFVIGVAGDGREQVFGNEIDYLATLAATRLDAAGRMLALVNRPRHQLPPGALPPPRATLDNLRAALAGIADKMEPGHDLLLLYMASHGSENHRFILADHHGLDEAITPQQLRQALDEAGIEQRILIVSACFSGGFIPALSDPDTLVLTAAAHNRSSFGCGAGSTFTWFGRALLMEGFRSSANPITAFQHARKAVKQREGKFDYPASRPQMDIGEAIRARIEHWLASLPEMPDSPDFPDISDESELAESSR